MLCTAALALAPRSTQQRVSDQRSVAPVRGVFDALTGGGETFSDAQTLPGRWRLSFALPALDRRATVIAEFADELDTSRRRDPCASSARTAPRATRARGS